MDIKKREVILRAMQGLVLLSLINTILNLYTGNFNFIVVLILLVLILAGNNYIRSRLNIEANVKGYLFSYAISVILIGFFSYKLKSFATDALNVILLIEILVVNKKVNILAIIFTFTVYFIANAKDIHWTDFNSIGNTLVNYLCTFSIIFVFRSVLVEKKRMENLNKELEDANLTLKKYSDKIEELTIAKERTRIAQELHDSIGHSLVALKMNLEYAENVAEVQPKKAKEVINKAQEISQDCIANLRKAVSLLKEEAAVEKLREAINELFENFKASDHIRFELVMDNDVEQVSPDIKNCIYRTVREAITNGIKHGTATVFIIEIFKENGIISLNVKNNGLECSNIIASNGIRGIEDRINALGGHGKFNSKKGCGFVVEVTIPEQQ